MAYANSNNTANFIGWLVKDPEITTVGKGKNQFQKAVVTLGVPRLYKADRPDSEPSSDFPRIEFLGDGIVGYIENHFHKGKPASIMASFKTFTWEKDGDTQYGQSFDGVAIQFVPGAKSEDDSSGGGSKKRKTNKKKQKKVEDVEIDDEDDDFEIDDEDDIPF